jgi:hypothetical protein
MKKFILKNYYTAQIVILNVRVYILTNDYNFVQEEASKMRIRDKIEFLNSRILGYFLKIQML